jgi:hypothetical protein
VEADEPRLFKKRSMQHQKTCQHVAEYNIYGKLSKVRTQWVSFALKAGLF